MKAVLLVSLLATAATYAFGAAPSGTYSVGCKQGATDCTVISGRTTVNTAGYFEAGFLDYTDNLFTTGWDNITVTLNETTPYTDLSLDNKYFGMGFVEGYVTYERIYQNYANVNSEFANMLNNDTIGWWNNNMQFVQTFVQNNPTDAYAAKIGNLYSQVRGMHAGYVAGCAAFNAPASYDVIDEQTMFMINWQAEIGDIFSAYAPNSEIAKAFHAPENQHCSALVKPVKDDLFVSHIAWTGFSWMMRQYKTYQFEGKSFVTVAGHPGMIHSMDDWYMSGRGLTAIETTIIINNPQLFVDNIKGKYESVPSFIRVMAANYLADTTTEWMALFGRLQSGTYNNQWMVVDMKLYNGNPKNLPDGLFGVIETLPGTFVAADQTQFLRDNDHWPSYNFAYYPKIQDLANYAGEYQMYGEGMTFHGYNRARIFARDHNKVVDMPTMEYMMQYNDYKNDPLSAIPNCTGAINNTCLYPNSAMLTISSRGDLNPAGGKDQYGIMVNMVGQRDHGGIDLKISSWSGMMRNDGNFVARMKNGPTTSNGLPVFAFSTCAIANIPSLGLPDSYNFAIESFTSSPRVAPTPGNGNDEYDNSGMGAALLIISLIIIVFSVSMLIVCHFIPKRHHNDYAQV